jgi:hypothetical protein
MRGVWKCGIRLCVPIVCDILSLLEGTVYFLNPSVRGMGSDIAPRIKRIDHLSGKDGL